MTADELAALRVRYPLLSDLEIMNNDDYGREIVQRLRTESALNSLNH